jgi:tRNA pseudouridine55 synthase
MPSMHNGFVLIDKPEGISSHDAVNQVRRALQTKKAGHAGTLDPLATGLLVIAVGTAARFIRYLSLEPKTYEAAIRFGIETDTHDSTGRVIQTHPTTKLTEQSVRETASKFTGFIHQTPPMFSAVKIGGKKLYSLARKGQTVSRKPRKIHVERFDITEFKNDSARAQIVCSTGTYVRTLIHDVGCELGTGAHMTALRRIAMGRFRVEHAVLPNAVKPSDLIAPADALSPMQMITISKESALKICRGSAVEAHDLEHGSLVGLIGPAGTLIAVGRVRDESVHPERVVPAMDVE